MEEVCPAVLLQRCSVPRHPAHWWHIPGAGEAKASSPSRGGARKCPAQAHTVKPLVTRWDVKGRAERGHRYNWTEARLSSLHGSSS